MIVTCGEFEIDDDLSRIDFERVHCWLASSYWSPGISREKVEKAAANSAMVIGGYRNGVQAGYLRVISDKTTFAWICDVFVDEDHRGLGLARGMVRYAQAHPDFQGLRRWVLATKDAHSVYASAGFIPLPEPQRWMIYFPPREP
jgi:GNAT superfamily N-acetyltransferase